jgi:hypothetical protein
MSNVIPDGLEVLRVVPRPVEMQAALVYQENLEAVHRWITDNGFSAVLGTDQLIIQTFEGPFTVRIGDAVVRGPHGFTRAEGGDDFKAAFDVAGTV